MIYQYPFITFHRSFQGELILEMTYEYEVKGRYDRKLDVSRQLSEFGSKIPGSASLINAFPFSVSGLSSAQHIELTNVIITIPVRYIPAWVPYFSFEPLASIGRTLGQEVLYEPMRFVKESIVSNGPQTIIWLRIICDRPVAQLVLRLLSNTSRRLRTLVDQIAARQKKR